MDYNYNDDSLIHSVGFDFSKMESIFKYGILSLKYASERGVTYSKNFFGYNPDDMISLVRYIYVNFDDLDSAYNKYIMKGISFNIEDVHYIYDKRDIVIHRADEVYVKNYVDVNKIKGINVPNSYLDKDFNELDVLPLNSTSYINIKHICDNIIAYMRDYGYNIDLNIYNEYLRKMYFVNNLYKKMDEVGRKKLALEFSLTVRDLNAFMGSNYKKMFSIVLKKDDISVMDVVNYINSKYYNLPVYVLDNDVKKM